MTEDRLPLAELLAKAGDGGVPRSVAEAVVRSLTRAQLSVPQTGGQATSLVGARGHDRLRFRIMRTAAA